MNLSHIDRIVTKFNVPNAKARLWMMEQISDLVLSAYEEGRRDGAILTKEEIDFDADGDYVS